MVRGKGEGSVYRRKTDGRWVGSIHIGTDGTGKRQRRAFYGDTQAAVIKRLQAAQSTIDKGLPIPPERLTVAQLLDEWIESKTNLRPRTRVRYLFDIEAHLKPSLGAIKVRNLTAANVRRMMAAEAKAGLAPNSIRNIRAVLVAALKFGQAEGYCAQNVAALTEAPAADESKVEGLSSEQAGKVLEALRGHRLFLAFVVSLHTGLRQGELLALRWADVNLDAKILTVTATLHRRDRQYFRDPTKTKASRDAVALTDAAVEALRRRRIQQKEEQLAAADWTNRFDLVFTAADGAPVYGPGLTRQFQRLIGRAELPPMVMHELRHGTATLMLSQGVPITSVSRALRHTTIQVTANTYGHILPEVQRDAASKLGNALGGLT